GLTEVNFADWFMSKRGSSCWNAFPLPNVFLSVNTVISIDGLSFCAFVHSRKTLVPATPIPIIATFMIHPPPPYFLPNFLLIYFTKKQVKRPSNLIENFNH